LYTTAGKEENLNFNRSSAPDPLSLPVIFIVRQAGKKYLNDPAATIDIKFKTSISDKKRKSLNVVGYIDKGSPLTVVIGAHFDHLGHGEDGSSREIVKKGEIHNGADDNASGTAALIEIAREIKGSRLKNYNYLFIAFSGEELGLLGSKYFTEHPTIDLKKVNYMINMDMVGRLNDSSHTVIVGGFGTSPAWGSLYNQKGRHELYSKNLVFHFDSSGTGQSDHTSFYLKDIPVLFYFTGVHADYHKPTDDYDKINFIGENRVIKHIYSLIETEDKEKNKLPFSKTRSSQSATTAHFSVTLGIMPDYAFSGTGIRIDAVMDNRPAQKAGLKEGDIIMALGTYKVPTLEEYMQTLGKFKKGDSTSVVYSRNNQIFTAQVEF
jgi:Zn-dependent M28 family amino/carboxypeptidase